MKEEGRGSLYLCRSLAIIILLCEVCFSFVKADSFLRIPEISVATEQQLESRSLQEREVSAPVKLEGRQQTEALNHVRRNLIRRFSGFATAILSENPNPEIPEPTSVAVHTETEYSVYGHTAIVWFIHSVDGKKS